MRTILDQDTIDGIQWELIKTATTKHRKNGKANLHVEVTYSVERTDGALDADFNPIKEDRQRFWMKSKNEATKHFKSLVKQSIVVERQGAAALNRIFG